MNSCSSVIYEPVTGVNVTNVFSVVLGNAVAVFLLSCVFENIFSAAI